MAEQHVELVERLRKQAHDSYAEAQPVPNTVIEVDNVAVSECNVSCAKGDCKTACTANTQHLSSCYCTEDGHPKCACLPPNQEKQ